MADRKPPAAGKGDNRRPEDFKTIQNNWDEIDWGRSSNKIEGFRGKPKRKYNVPSPVPKNEFGIIVHHTDDGIPLDDKSLKAIIEGPVAAMEPAYQAELKKPIEINLDKI